MADMNDDELEKLLGELGSTDPLPSKLPPAPKPASKKKKRSDDEEDDEEDVIIAAPRPTPKAPAPPPQKLEDDLLMLQTEPEEKQELPAVLNEQLQRAMKQYGSVFTEIINNYKKDRQQAQEVIDAFMSVIIAGGKIPRVYLEKVADAVRAKNEIAQTAIKALDSLPKLVAATKNNEAFNQVNMSFDTSALKQLLDSAESD